MSFALLNLLIGVAAGSCVAVLGLRSVLLQARRIGAWLVFGICAAVLCNLMLGFQEYAPFEPPFERIDTGVWAPALNFVRNIAPGLFMLEAHRRFVDGLRFPRWLLAAFILQLGLEAIAYFAPSGLGVATIPAALQVMFAGLALYWTLEGWPGDLIQIRRRARLAVTVVVGVVMGAPSLVLRLMILPGAWSFYTQTLLNILTLLIAAALLILEQDGGAIVDESVSASTTPPRSSKDDADLQRILDLIADERIQFETDLTLAQFAKRAKLPEYRFRQLVHGRLGQPNFNAFLHGLRIAEARRRLRDPEETRTPILTLALSLGYGSVNTFNRAFRQAVGCTPSQYRARTDVEAGAPNFEISPQFLQSAPG